MAMETGSVPSIALKVHSMLNQILTETSEDENKIIPITFLVPSSSLSFFIQGLSPHGTKSLEGTRAQCISIPTDIPFSISPLQTSMDTLYSYMKQEALKLKNKSTALLWSCPSLGRP
eukprot:TRINITY_DN35570_c0_g1_i1.p1 TRINITY_DN35570_c0_g1~~TRINITY_DN35570_c0_g1_i1.p1  ORF type:complete len:117 (+),score=11.85 TRINITY_DN35570_c0_g1_i1:124-474(+)